MRAPEADEFPADDPSREGVRRLLRFRLGADGYAVPCSAVSALFECGELYPVPGAPAAVLGLSAWRGNLLTVVDLHRVLSAPACGAPPCLLLLAAPLQQTALCLRAALRMEELDAPRALDSATPAERLQGLAGTLLYRGERLRLIDPLLVVRRLEAEPPGCG